MISYFQALVLGLLQGLTELFPVSSLGHSVIAPALFGWSINQSAPSFLVLLVATHLATALVLIGFFWLDWVLIIRGILRSLIQRKIAADDTYAKLGWLIVAASIPAGLLGFLLQAKLSELFAAPAVAAVFLVVNGLVLFLAEYVRKRKQGAAREAATRDDAAVARISYRSAFGIGVAQCLALIPGFSRTGTTLCGGLLSGLDHENSARFSFLLAAPLILAAAVLKLPLLLLIERAGARPGRPRFSGRRRRRLSVRAIPGPLFQNEDTEALCDLLRRRGRRLFPLFPYKIRNLYKVI